ncbi:hypothetical protein [Ralstonia solanacearum]|uniref:Uncharacterized protein n=1 Tax=Ralstonia solanacearum TaxID=305 RepID=A0AAE3T1R9_RALSL|nr:hypothetical protein [Ralstonia solanacearum]MBB6583980.1 hypothetical protein [Ralstonia solanacearum]MDB0520269.1 hypothetical protein [Ralstonia solanacearum]
MTLSENQGSGGLPGPTDYVALIGSASLSDAAARNVAAQPAYAGKVTIPRPFVRAWLNDSERAAMEVSFLGHPAYDVRRLTAKPTKRAVAVPGKNGHWLFYLEYVSPGVPAESTAAKNAAS